MSIEEIVLEAEERMEKSVALLADQLRGVRTGRANVGLVESIRVEYYGSPTPLKQMANLSTPEPQQILIRPFDPSVIGDIVKAIQASDIRLTPNSDGKGGRRDLSSSSDVALFFFLSGAGGSGAVSSGRVTGTVSLTVGAASFFVVGRGGRGSRSVPLVCTKAGAGFHSSFLTGGLGFGDTGSVVDADFVS